jgi:hypothetical protein
VTSEDAFLFVLVSVSCCLDSALYSFNQTEQYVSRIRCKVIVQRAAWVVTVKLSRR